MNIKIIVDKECLPKIQEMFATIKNTYQIKNTKQYTGYGTVRSLSRAKSNPIIRDIFRELEYKEYVKNNKRKCNGK